MAIRCVPPSSRLDTFYAILCDSASRKARLPFRLHRLHCLQSGVRAAREPKGTQSAHSYICKTIMTTMKLVPAGLLWLLGLELALVLAVTYENCAPHHELGEWSEVSVLGCRKNASSCVFRRNQKTAISIYFTNKKRERRLTSVVNGILGGVEIPFTLKNPNACFNTGLTCPLEPGNHTYTYSIFVEKDKPGLKLKLKWEIQNEWKEPIVCVLIPARIK